MSAELRSAVTFAFTFNPPAGPIIPQRKPSLPSSFPAYPRPTSLLQRGRSFTSEDITSMPAMSKMCTVNSPSMIDDYDHAPLSSSTSSSSSSSSLSQPLRSVSSPVSNLSGSPSSSVSSKHSMEELIDSDSMACETLTEAKRYVSSVNFDEEPFTPLNQMFPGSIHPFAPRPSKSNDSTPGSHATSSTIDTTPAITLTLHSPTSTQTSTNAPKLLAASQPQNQVCFSTKTAQAFESLSLNDTGRIIAPPPAPKASRRKQSITVTGMPFGGTSLTRSLSEGVLASAVESRIPLSMGMTSSTSDHSIETLADLPQGTSHVRRTSSTLPKPLIKRQKSNGGPGLSVFVPRPGGLGFGRGARFGGDELRSPFEHKPASTGAMSFP